MNNELILNVLYKALGPAKKTARNNYAFKCPNGCHPNKNKLEVNINTYQYQCWICGGQNNGYNGGNLLKLLSQSQSHISLINELKPLIKSGGTYEKPHIINILELPKEFKTFLNNKDIIAKHALTYLKNRNITKQDILKYNIGYCDSGQYAKMIVIPSYDADGKLNYYTARSFEKDPYTKYRNPETSRDIIPFELFINWDLPIILCEGPFDAMAIKRNAVPLFGKNIQSSLMKKLVESKVQKIYIALDNDAVKQALKFCEQLLDVGKEIYLVELQGKDPSEMGFEHFTKLIQNTQPLTQYKLMEKKLSII